MGSKIGKNAKLLIASDLIYSLTAVFIETFLVAYLLNITNENITTISIYYITIYSLLSLGNILIGKVIKKYPSKNKQILSLGIVSRALFILFIVILSEKIATNFILIAIILGFIDGFNPCAMWILLLLINMCISIKDKKKMLIVCLTFIITSGIIYFLSMLGIGFILDLTTISYIRNIIAILAIILGIYNLYTYLKTRKQTGCHVVKKEKRKTIITKINNILNNKNTLLMFGGTIILATSVSLVEMACSLGFPTIFLELLSINNIHSFLKVTYLLIYILFYLIDDIIVLFLSIKAFETKGISTKYNKYVHLIGGLIMILMGVLLIFKPEWIMFNF